MAPGKSLVTRIRDSEIKSSLNILPLNPYEDSARESNARLQFVISFLVDALCTNWAVIVVFSHYSIRHLSAAARAANSDALICDPYFQINFLKIHFESAEAVHTFPDRFDVRSDDLYKHEKNMISVFKFLLNT